MNEAESLLNFLAEHQPLVVDDENQKEMILARFDETIQYFSKVQDARCVPLILGFFGNGNGYGVYQLAEDAIFNQDPKVVIPALCDALLGIPRPLLMLIQVEWSKGARPADRAAAERAALAVRQRASGGNI